MYKEVFIEDRHGFEGTFASFVNVLFVVRIAAYEWAEPASKGWEDFGVGEGHPADDGGIILLGLAEKAGFLVLRRDCCALARVLSHCSTSILGEARYSQSVNNSQQ